MTTEAMNAFWQCLSAAPHVFVSLTGEEFHARPLKAYVDADAGQIWVVVPQDAAMARRLHLNTSAFIIVTSRDGTFAGKAFGELVVSDDDVSRRRLLRAGNLWRSDLDDCVLARFAPQSGEAWLGSNMCRQKLRFAEVAKASALPANVVRMSEVQQRIASRAAE